MPTNYSDSAKRHLKDAEFLWATQDPSRVSNAGQFFGFSAECSLKAVLVGLGVPTHPGHGGVADRRTYGHLPGLWQQFTVYAAGQLGGKYLALLDPGVGVANPFSTWSVDDRYAPDVWLVAQHPNVAHHRTGAADCMALLELAKEDGIV